MEQTQEVEMTPSQAIVAEVMTRAQRKAAKRAAKATPAETVEEVIETVVVTQATTPAAPTLYNVDEERERYLNRALAVLAAKVPGLTAVLGADVRLAVANMKGKLGKGWMVNQATSGRGHINIDARIDNGRAALARAAFCSLYVSTGYDGREMRKQGEQAGFVFATGKGSRTTGWAGDMTPELAAQIDDALTAMGIEYPQHDKFAEGTPRGRSDKGSRAATMHIHGSPTGDERIEGNVHGGRVFIAQFAADLAKAGYWVSVEDKDTDAILAANEATKQATEANEINRALAA